MIADFFKSREVLTVGNKQYVIYRLDALEKAGLTRLDKLPYSVRVLLEVGHPLASGLVSPSCRHA